MYDIGSKMKWVTVKMSHVHFFNIRLFFNIFDFEISILYNLRGSKPKHIAQSDILKLALAVVMK